MACRRRFLGACPVWRRNGRCLLTKLSAVSEYVDRQAADCATSWEGGRLLASPGRGVAGCYKIGVSDVEVSVGRVLRLTCQICDSRGCVGAGSRHDKG